jgi:hypothetical protein
LQIFKTKSKGFVLFFVFLQVYGRKGITLIFNHLSNAMRYALLFFLFPFFAAGQPSSAINKDIFQPTLNKDSVLREFAIVYDLLNTVHPGEFMHCNKTSLDRCFDSLSRSIQTDLSPAAYYLKISCLLSKVKDRHTFMNNAVIKEGMQTALVFPFSIYKINDQYIVNKSGEPEYAYHIGKTISRINGKTMSAIVSTLTPYFSIEGNNETNINTYLQLFPFFYGLTDTAHVFTVTFKDSLGTEIKKTINGISFQTFQRNTRKIVGPIQHEFKRNNLAILTVNTFLTDYFEQKNINYKKNIDEFFERVAELKITNIIIDVRNNPGGSPEISNYLFSYLSNKPYYYFEYMGKKYKKAGSWKNFCTTPDRLDKMDAIATQPLNNLFCQTEKTKPTEWWFKQQHGKKNYFKGNVITLIDGGCFSTTGHFIALLKTNHIGKLYGECSQGSFYSNDGGNWFTLPYSNYTLRIPTAQFKMRMPDFNYDPKGICPDKEITKQPEDFIIGYDRVLNAAKEDLTNK